MVMYLASGELTTAFHRSFAVVMSAVFVVNLPGYLIRLPPAVRRTQLGSSFCGQKSTTILVYIMILSFGILAICS